MEINHRYVSPREYSEQTGLGVEEIKRLCRIGRIPCERSDGGYYYIKVYKDDCVDRKEYDRVVKENIELKALVKNIHHLSLIEEEV